MDLVLIKKIDFLKKKLSGEIDPKMLVNVLLYLVILVMPFIVVNVSNPRYVIGKVIFLYIIGIVAIILSIKLGLRDFKKEHSIALIFLLTIFVPSILSPTKYTAFMGNYERSEGFVMFCVYIILFILASKYLKLSKKRLNLIMIVACIMAIYGIFQFYGIDPVQQWMFGKIVVGESFGFIGHRNFFSTYICLFLFLSTAIYIFKGNRKFIIYSGILFTALLCTLTRGGWISLFIYLVLVLSQILKSKNLIKRFGCVLLVFIAIFLILNITSNGKVTERADKNLIVSEDGSLNGSAGSRANIMRVAFKAFKDKPLLGYGPDTLKSRLTNDYPNEITAHMIKYHEYIDKSHNEFLEYAVNNGIFTLLSYLVLMGIIIYKLIKDRKNDTSKVLLLTLAGYLMQSFLNISVIMVAPLFWIFLGVCVKNTYGTLEDI